MGAALGAAIGETIAVASELATTHSSWPDLAAEMGFARLPEELRGELVALSARGSYRPLHLINLRSLADWLTGGRADGRKAEERESCCPVTSPVRGAD